MAMGVAPKGWWLIVPVVILAAVALLVQWYIAAIVLSAGAVFLFASARRQRVENGAH